MSYSVAANNPTSVFAALSIFAAGLLFGLGLMVSGMTNPSKVIGFLDVAGNWDPSLILVMVSSLGVCIPSFKLILRRQRPLFEDKFYLPTAKDLDSRLLGGAALFGIGWGIAGLCPGPAITALVTMNNSIVLFVIAMLGGMALHRFILE